MELGLATFADLSSGIAPEQRMRDLLEEAVLADQLGLDVFAVGEHHRPDFLVSSPATALAAIAVKTERIRLSSAVTVLSSDDPVRVFQQFAHVDLLSGGRAEIMAGRGSFIESFPLFGYDLDDYDELFQEKLELLLEARSSEVVYWPGTTHTQRVENRGVYPRPLQDPLPVRIAVARTPQSLAREQFEAGGQPGGHLLVGSPEEVAEKILEQHEIFGHDRFLAQLSVGPMPHAELMRAIELLGTEVAPVVRDEVAKRRSSTQMSGLR